MISRRKIKDKMFAWIARILTYLTLVFLLVLIWSLISQGFSSLSWDFLNNFPSRFASRAGIKAALFGSLWLMGLTALFSIPLGIAAAVYLEEFAKKNRLSAFIELNIANLAGTPSIIYGFIGLAVFVRTLGFGRSLWAGSLTLALLTLPTIIIASREALKGVPATLREAAFALGATEWQCVWGQVLPAAVPGILTGVILALSRAIGETAPLIMIGALSYVAFVPEGPSDQFTALPIQIFNWASRPQDDFHSLAAGAILVLLVVLFSLNLLALTIRMRAEARNRL